jgi:hypothetical protein
MSVRSKLTARAEPEGSGDTGLRQPAASPADDGKTRTELLEDVAHLRQRLTTLESLEVDRRTIEAELKGTRQRLQYLLAVSPAIIYPRKQLAITPAPSSARISATLWATRPKR